ncbi:APC family permease [Pseudobacillus wudalianchiensis]|uniref:APC family permease n=1 Tax=Pseudobacillus wudalianchiensis TaxID=1743143 RepID=UPI00080867BE|nr:APC family permease [Bacillus wudalianchiensis]
MTKQLKRRLGLWAAVATGVGIVVSSSALVSLGQGFGAAGPGFILAMGVALFLNLCVAFSFAELSSIIPRAGGINHFTLPALGPFMGMVAVISGYVLVTIFAGSAEAGIAGIVFRDVFAPGINPMIISLALVILLGMVNVLGVEVYSTIQIILTTLLIASTVILGIIGLTGIGATGTPVPTTLEFNPSGWGVFGFTALAIWLFVGVEFVTPMAEEIKKPKIYVPLAMILSLVIILLADALFGFAAIKYAPLQLLGESASPHVEAAGAILGKTGQTWMGIVTILATVSTLNTLICAIARMVYSMGLEGQMPKVFGKTNRYGSPWAAVVLMCALFVVFLLVGLTNSASIVTFILAGCFCWLVTYFIAHLNVVILRYKYPNVKRTFKSPLGFTFQIIGMIGILYVMFNMSPDAALRTEIYKYSLWFLGLTVIYAALWVKFVMKKGIFQTIPLEELIETTSTAPRDSADELKEDVSI